MGALPVSIITGYFAFELELIETADTRVGLGGC